MILFIVQSSGLLCYFNQLLVHYQQYTGVNFEETSKAAPQWTALNPIDWTDLFYKLDDLNLYSCIIEMQSPAPSSMGLVVNGFNLFAGQESHNFS